jgi:hypothetical protein
MKDCDSCKLIPAFGFAVPRTQPGPNDLHRTLLSSVGSSASYSAGRRFRYRSWDRLFVLRFLFHSSQHLQAGMMPEMRPRQRPFTFSTMIHSFNPLKTEFLLNDIYKSSSYLTGNTLRLHHKAQPVNAVWGNSHWLVWEPYGTHRYTVWAECRVLVC